MGLVILIFDLLTLTGTRVASKVGNLNSEFGHGVWVLELFAMYATDGRTDKSNAYCCPLPYGRGYNKTSHSSLKHNFGKC